MSVDLSPITNVIDFGTITTAILGVFAVLVVVYVTKRAISMLVHAVRGNESSAATVEAENEARRYWDGMDQSEKDFLRVTSYSEWRERFASF